jgi:hypothetical protein
VGRTHNKKEKKVQNLMGLQQLDEQCIFSLLHTIYRSVPHNFQPLQINQSASFNQIPR